MRLSPAGAAAAIGHLILAIRAIAPLLDYGWLKSLRRRHVAAKTRRDKRPLLVRADELVAPGFQLMYAAERDGVVRDVLAYRDGLIIALLASRPMRRGNLTTMCLDKHVSINGNEIRVSFGEDEMKGGREFELWAPDQLVPAFLRYSSIVRPRFPNASEHSFVWCSMKAGSLKSDGVYQMIIRRTKEAFGKPVRPHLFRDIAATAIAMDRPEQVQIARGLLGHASLELTERHYLHAQSVKAGQHYGKLIGAIRGGRNGRPS